MAKIIYTEKDGDGKLEKAGEFPFTRGVHPTMYTQKLWTMRQYAGFGDAKASNKRYHYLISQGTTGLSVAFDLPTQMGYDCDDPMALGEVGKVGVAISCFEDIETLFKDISLEDVSTSMTINATASILLAFYLCLSKKKGIAWSKLRGTIQNDVLKEYIARGTYIFPPNPSLKITTDIFEFCKNEVPGWNTISISGYHIREAGSTAVQEIAFTLSNGLTYVEQALKKGLKIDDFAPRLSFFFNVHNNFLEEVAKFRAARRLWSKLIKERYHPKDPKSLMLRFHAQTAGSTLIADQIDTNVVRVTLQCMAAVLGGAQSIHTNSKDEALSLPSEEAAKTALRTQQVIAHESEVSKIVDPLGGSYFVEAMTDQLEKEALNLILEIEKKGGVVSCIEEGFQQSLIQEASFRYQMEIEQKKRIVVGLNEFLNKDKSKNQAFKIDEKIEKDQVQRLKRYKNKREQKKVNLSKEKLGQAAKENKNLMPVIIDAIENELTLGEMIHALTEVYGRYKP